MALKGFGTEIVIDVDEIRRIDFTNSASSGSGPCADIWYHNGKHSVIYQNWDGTEEHRKSFDEFKKWAIEQGKIATD